MHLDLSAAVLRRAPMLVVRDLGDHVMLLGPGDRSVRDVRGPAAALVRAAASASTIDVLDDRAGIDPHEAFATVAQLVRDGVLEPCDDRPAADTRVRRAPPDEVLVLAVLRPWLPATADGDRAWLDAVVRERIVPLAAWAADRGAVRIGGDVRDELRAAATERIVWSMTVERAGIRAVTALEAAGIDVIVLKGLATAHADYSDPWMRELGDVDLLVRSSDVVAADTVLASMATPADEVSAALRLRNKERTFLTVDAVEIDLHHRLLEDPFGFAVPIDELFAAARTIEVAGVRVRILGDAHRLAHAVGHWAASILTSRRTNGLVDASLMARSSPALADGARASLASWSLGCLATAVPSLPGSRRRDAAAVLGMLHRRALRGSRLAMELAPIVSRPTIADAVREAWSRLVPGDELMALHGVSRTRRLQRFAVRLVTRPDGFEAPATRRAAR